MLLLAAAIICVPELFRHRKTQHAASARMALPFRALSTRSSTQKGEGPWDLQ